MAQQVNRYLKFPPPSWEQPKSPDPKLAPKTFTVVGSDPLTGRSVVSQPGAAGTLTVRGGSGLVGFSVPVQTAETDSGGRKLFTLSSEFTGEPKGGFVRFVGPGTPSGSSGPDCDNDPDPPPPPEPEPEPESSGGGGDAGGLSGPTAGGSNPCNPQSKVKWYNGAICPAGMAKLGEATLEGGEIQSLCQGVGPPPDCEPPLRWVCDSTTGSCVQSTGGIYETKEECEAAGCKIIRYACVSGQCLQTEGGNYATYEDCLASRCQASMWRRKGEGCGCELSPEGTYSTEQDCLSTYNAPRQLLRFYFGDPSTEFNWLHEACLISGPFVRKRAEGDEFFDFWEWYGCTRTESGGVIEVVMDPGWWWNYAWDNSYPPPYITNVTIVGPC